MMRSTAAVQVNVDLGDPAEGERRWRLAHDIGPVLIAAFANSPLAHGRPTGWRSTRLAVWFTVDPGRTAPVLSTTSGPPSWADYALAARVMFVRDAEHASQPPGRDLPFAAWIAAGHPLGWPTPEDLQYHLTTLFPPVRPRGWLELRMIDSVPDPWWRVAAAVASTLVTDPGIAERVAAGGATGRAGGGGTPLGMVWRTPNSSEPPATASRRPPRPSARGRPTLRFATGSRRSSTGTSRGADARRTIGSSRGCATVRSKPPWRGIPPRGPERPGGHPPRTCPRADPRPARALRRRRPGPPGLAAHVAALLGPRAHRPLRRALAAPRAGGGAPDRPAFRRPLRRVPSPPTGAGRPSDPRAGRRAVVRGPDPSAGPRDPRARRARRRTPRPRCVRVRHGRPARAPAPRDDARHHRPHGSPVPVGVARGPRRHHRLGATLDVARRRRGAHPRRERRDGDRP